MRHYQSKELLHIVADSASLPFELAARRFYDIVDHAEVLLFDPRVKNVVDPSAYALCEVCVVGGAVEQSVQLLNVVLTRYLLVPPIAIEHLHVSGEAADIEDTHSARNGGRPLQIPLVIGVLCYPGGDVLVRVIAVPEGGGPPPPRTRCRGSRRLST